jgi:hypothetical protein
MIMALGIWPCVQLCTSRKLMGWPGGVPLWDAAVGMYVRSVWLCCGAMASQRTAVRLHSVQAHCALQCCTVRRTVNASLC